MAFRICVAADNGEQQLAYMGETAGIPADAGTGEPGARGRISGTTKRVVYQEIDI